MAAWQEQLAELHANRAAGRTRLATYQVPEAEKIYEEVDEEGYKDIVRKRLDRDDFVVDDNGDGYADDGREDWVYERNVHDSATDDELPAKKKASKRKRDDDRQRKEKMNQGISKFLNNNDNQARRAKPKISKTTEDDEFMASLLGEVDVTDAVNTSATRNTIKSQARRKIRVLSPSPDVSKARRERETRADDRYLPDTPPAETAMDNEDVFMRSLEEDDAILPSDPQLPSSPLTKATERKAQTAIKDEYEDEEEFDDAMEVNQAVGRSVADSGSVNISASRPAPAPKKAPYPSPESSSPTLPSPQVIDSSSWNDVATKLNVLSSDPVTDTPTFGKLAPKDILEDDGSLRFFWLDYTEVNGSLCLFGKVKNRSNGSSVSCFVKVDNILRKLFFLPRPYRHQRGTETQERVKIDDVCSEVGGIMSNFGVSSHKMKPCSRKYAFELPDIPQDGEYLKVLYPYDKSPFPMDLQGQTFSRVFGTNTALFEQFVLWRKIKGPCWLKIEDANYTALHNASWCKFEVLVSRPDRVSNLDDSEDSGAPPLTIMSIALRTTLNARENKQEILVASARIYENVSLGDTTPADRLPCRTFTVMRRMGRSYPLGFEAEARKHRGVIRLEKTETMLLSSFLAKIQQYDPDVLVGHQLEGVDYSVLLTRMRELRTPQWHRIGRLKRSEWPKNFGRLGGSFFLERQLVSGRLLCDLANDFGKSLTLKCQSWSLTEMCEIVLGDSNARRDIDNEAALSSWAQSREGLMNYLSHCEADTYFIAAIALKLQMLPLAKILTNLAGNSWSRTLCGTRAERNEYILLHEFHKNKYICPDKVFGKDKQQKAFEDSLDGDDTADIKKKDKYKGGLVFEPEKGLYDKFILVMDFNSLYPSIIQEFNICFTTVDRTVTSGDDENVPRVPSSDLPQGTLPRLIATLVNRRKQVKSLMKDKRATQDELAIWDIKQLALKLTANSMYGCLGYTKSRFYARPLAMLTTYKGREILRSTKDLAESTQLRVIYGDTDSVMINTNASSMQDALKVGNDFKRAVNERYKLLEIDIDNVFRRLLLHAKKKYAAINMVQVDGKYVDRLEVKGLDMRRREYCALSKEVSSKLLNVILSGEEAEVSVEKIHDILRDTAQKMQDGAVPVQKYIIFTKLGKNPKEYPNADSMPQVQVALRAMAQGKTVRANDVMSYITTGDSQSSEHAAKRAYAPQDVLKPESELKPDVEWYLYKQIFPPVERLCAPIEGTNAVRLADCLGLDTRKYQINDQASNDAQQEIFPLESQMDDEVRFKDAARLKLRCRYCRTVFMFEGLASSSSASSSPPLEICTPNGLRCPNRQSCGKLLPTLSLAAQLESRIRHETARYYEGWLVCDDSSCANRTRQMSVYGHRCLGPRGQALGCLGRMRYEFSEKMMYNQLLYFASLWDVENAKRKAKGDDKESILTLAEHNRRRFTTLKKIVDRYLDKCGRQWVAMDSLFGFARRR